MSEVKIKAPQRHYEHFIWNSQRWEGFDHRPDDILICTAYKAGTTWTQRICSLLVFQTAKLERPLTTYSPWLEINGQPVEKLRADYKAQDHRRFIKTHTPLDGLPWSEENTYLFVARDPRDIFMSMLGHMANSLDAAGELIAQNSTVEKVEFENPPTEIPDILRAWLTTGMFSWEEDGWPFWSAFAHARSFWAVRDRPNVHCFHYKDMLEDLDGEMRRMSKVLGIPVNEDIWPSLVKAAEFGSMKENADQMAPDVDWGGWKDNRDFFKRGGSGNWQDVFTPEDLAFYEEKVQEKLPVDLHNWIHEGGPIRP
jgi:aryl sulfotransferase